MSSPALILPNDEELRLFTRNPVLVQKNVHFNLKTALFVEKRQNKFAYELKWNKFVFNN